MKNSFFYLLLTIVSPAMADVDTDLDQYLTVNIGDVQNAVANAPVGANAMELSSFGVSLEAKGTFGIGEESDVKPSPKPPKPPKPSKGGTPGLKITVSPSLDLVFAPAKVN